MDAGLAPPTGQQRRVYLNLGARGYKDKSTTFFEPYPGSASFEHHVFEATPGSMWKDKMGWSSAAAQADKRIRFHNVAVWNRDTTLSFGVRKSASHVVEGTGGATGVFGNDTKV